MIVGTHLQVVNEELLESIRTHVLCFLVSSVTYIGHQKLALEPSADSVVNTFWLPPVLLKKKDNIELTSK